MRLLAWLVTNAVALATAAWLVDGVGFAGPSSGPAELREKVVPLLVVAAVLGVVTSVVKPVLTLLSFPLVLLTLGLFLLVINAAVLLLTGWVARELGTGFRVDGFWPALLGAVVVTVMTWVVAGLLRRDDDR